MDTKNILPNPVLGATILEQNTRPIAHLSTQAETITALLDVFMLAMHEDGHITNAVNDPRRTHARVIRDILKGVPSCKQDVCATTTHLMTH